MSPLKRTGSPTQDVFDPRQNVELSPRNLHVSQTMENLVPPATGTRPEDRPHHSSQNKSRYGSGSSNGSNSSATVMLQIELQKLEIKRI